MYASLVAFRANKRAAHVPSSLSQLAFRFITVYALCESSLFLNSRKYVRDRYAASPRSVRRPPHCTGVVYATPRLMLVFGALLSGFPLLFWKPSSACRPSRLMKSPYSVSRSVTAPDTIQFSVRVDDSSSSRPRTSASPALRVTGLMPII